MNVKLSQSSVTFKIPEKELYILGEGLPVFHQISLGGNTFSFAIKPVVDDDGNNEVTLPLKLIFRDTTLTLFVSKGHIEKLLDMGKSKEGICEHCDGIDLCLQVDLRSDSRQRNKDKT